MMETIKIDMGAAESAEEVLRRLLRIIQKTAQSAGTAFSKSVEQSKLLASIGKGAASAAKGQEALAKDTTAAGKAAKASVAGFDELNIVAAQAGAGSSKPGNSKPGSNKPESGKEEEPPGLSWAQRLHELLEKLRDIAEQLWPVAQWLWENFLEPLSDWTGEMAQIGLDGIAGAFAKISGWVEDNRDKLLKLLETVETVLRPIQSIVQGVLDGIKRYFELWWRTFSDTTVGLLDFLLGLLTGDWQQAWDGLGQILESWKTLALESLQIFWDTVRGGFENQWELITILFAPAVEWFEQNLLAPLRENFGWLWDGIATGADILLNVIKGIFGPIVRWVRDNILTPILGGIQSAWDEIAGASSAGFGLLLDGAKGYIRDLQYFFAVGVNMIVSLINKIIDALNTISVDIPDWVPKYGGQSFGINIPHVPQVTVPKLATGAVIPPNAQFLAVLGDQKRGRNLEAPEGLIRQIVREESMGNSSDGQPLQVELLLDGDMIYRAVVDRQNRQGYQVGGVFANAY